MASTAEQRPSHLLVFDTGGVTGHSDHQQATTAALAAARTAGRTVLAWTVPLEYLRTLFDPKEGTTPMSYAYTTRLPEPFSPALVDRVRAALKDQGFGVLTEIDVQATLQAKLGVATEEYLILGACNPPLAHRALDIDREIGLLLPCNVVVRADGADACLVQALDPQTMVQVTGRPELKPVADDAAGRLRAALNQLGG